jgi:hypothetical protein
MKTYPVSKDELHSEIFYCCWPCCGSEGLLRVLSSVLREMRVSCGYLAGCVAGVAGCVAGAAGILRAVRWYLRVGSMRNYVAALYLRNTWS